jgi:hypothetical protein
MSLRFKPADRRKFIGGSDARIIMGDDEPALLRLWREKRREAEPEDLSGNPIVQLGLVAEHLCLFPDFMRFLETHAWPSAVFVNELDPGASQHRFDCSERCCIACIPTDPNIGDRVPMETCGFREVPARSNSALLEPFLLGRACDGHNQLKTEYLRWPRD